MRKVGSAPSLLNYSQSQQERQEPSQCPQRLPNSGSGNNLTKLGGSTNMGKDGMPRRGSLPGRLRDNKARAFPLAALDTSVPVPPDPAVSEEFAESARGIAGLECFELYGPKTEAPALQADANKPQKSLQQQSDEKEAFASCLATPLTGQDKNLGEQVEAEARAMLQIAQEDIAARYEQELSSQANTVTEAAAPESNSTTRRKRRLAEKLGFGDRREKRSSSELFHDCPEAQQMLAKMASIDDDSNRKPLQTSSEDSRETSYTLEKADNAIFSGNTTSSHSMREPKLPVSQSC